MKHKITKLIFLLVLSLGLTNMYATTTWLCSSASYNSGTKGYEHSGIATYFKSTSGGTATVNSGLTNCHGSTSNIQMGSSLFIIQATSNITGIIIYGNSGTGSTRTLSSVATSSTLAGTYTTLTGTSYSGNISGSNATNVCSPSPMTITFGTSISSGTFIKITLSGNAYVAAIDLTSPSAPSITGFIANGVTATIDQNAKTITAQIPYGSSLTGITPTVTIGGSATGYSPSGAQDFTNPVIYIATDGVTNVDYTVTLTVSQTLPAPTISLTSGNPTQPWKAGSTITNIVYSLTNATGATVEGLPTGLSGNYVDNGGNTGTFTISGTIDGGTTPNAYGFTVKATPMSGYAGSDITSTGTITVADPAKKLVAYVVNTGVSANDTQIKPYLDALYTLNTILIANVSTSTDFSAYDLVILTEAPSSGTAGMKALWGINKPLLNFKAFAPSR